MGGVARFDQWLKLHGPARIVDSGAMARIFPPSLLLAVAFVTACADEAPRELEGLWSRSEGACALGAGVRFETGAVRVLFGRHERVLFEAPKYRVERRGPTSRITINYESPAASGRDGARGVLILERGADDWVRPASHQFADKMTGAVRMRLGDEDAARFFTLHRCADPPSSRASKSAG